MARKPTDPLPGFVRADGLAYWHADGHWRLTVDGYKAARSQLPGEHHGGGMA